MDNKKHKFAPGWNLILYIIIPLLALFYPAEGNCSQDVKVVVKLIYASKDKKSIDPRIKNLVEDLNSAFVYSSYELVDQKIFYLKKGESAVFDIRGGRRLIITANGVNAGKAALEIECKKDHKEIIKTNIDFRNNGDTTFALPAKKGDKLFLHILASF